MTIAPAPDKDQLQDKLEQQIGPGQKTLQPAATVNVPAARSRIRQPANSVPPSARQAGINGSIGDVNHKLDTLHNTYMAAHGTPPSPGLALDIIRSPVPEERYQDLFQLPGVADATRVLTQHVGQNAADFLHVDPDTRIVTIHNPLESPPGIQGPIGGQVTITGGQVLGATLQGPAPPPTNQQAIQSLKTQYPQLASGMLPFVGANGPLSFVHAFLTQDKNAGSPIYQALKNGASFPELEQIIRNYYTSRMTQRAITGNIPADVQLQYQNLQKQLGAVTTVKDGQQVFNHLWGTDLPANGLWTSDWQSAYDKNSKNADVMYAYAQYQAKQMGYSSPEGLAHAIKTKQDVASHSGVFEWLVNSLPLNVFDFGSSPLDVLHGMAAYPFKDMSLGPLSIAENSASLAMNTIGGTVQSFKAATAGLIAIVNDLTPTWLNGLGRNWDQAIKDAETVIHKNPSWVRVIFPHATDAQIASSGAQIANLLGDLILLRKPYFTGEFHPFGAESILQSTHLNAVIPYSFDYLSKGQIGRAAAFLGGGKGAWEFVAAAEKGVRDGSLNQDAYSALAREYAWKKTVTIDGKTVSGGIANYLNHRGLTTPSARRLKFEDVARNWMDGLDQALRNSSRAGTDAAATAVSSSRSMFYHASPRGLRGLYDTGTPEALYNYVLKNFKDPELAGRVEDTFVRRAAVDDTVGLKKLEADLDAAYWKRFPNRKGKQSAVPAALKDFEPVLETEAPQTFHFPSGGYRDPAQAADAWQRVAIGWENSAKTTGRALNSIAVALSRAILVTGGSLFYKHAIADTAKRVYVQGLDALRPNLLSADERIALNRLWDSNPTLRRRYGIAYKRNRDMEARYMISGPGREETPVDFQTGTPVREVNGNTVAMTDKQWQPAAGGYLRRRLDSEMLKAYRESQATGDWTALAKAILGHRYFRARFMDELAPQIKVLKDEAASPQLTLPGAGRDYQQAVLDLAKDYAPKIAKEFQEVEQAAIQAGVTDPWTDAMAQIRDVSPKRADAILGKWISDQGIDMPVRDGKVKEKAQGVGQRIDQATGKMLEGIMVANKWNRSQFFQREFERKWADMVNAGVDPVAAHNVAVDLADRMVKYHMFDFANRLGAEQDLRFLSYFATKHRLNWKWIATQLVRRPGMAAAIQDVSNNLDQYGGFNFTLFGQQLSIPVARLFWVNSQQYPDASALVLAGYAAAKALPHGIGAAATAGANAAGGTYGNVFTRQDQTAYLAIKSLLAMGGNLTYSGAVEGLPDNLKRDIWHRLDMFQFHYMATHHGVPAPEAEAVKAVMWDATANQFWLSTMILPVNGIPGIGAAHQQSHTPFNDPKLAEWYHITDPKAKYEFERKHPEVLNRFGLYTDPRLYTENQAAFYKMNQAIRQRDLLRMQALDEAKRTGDAQAFMTVYDKTAADFGQVMTRLQAQYPDWAKTLAADPLASAQGELFKAFPNINRKDVLENVPSKDAAALGKQVDYFKRLSIDQSLTASQRSDYLKAYYDALAELSHVRSFPKNAAEATYVKVRNLRDAYTTWTNQQYAESKKLTGWHAEAFQAGYMYDREQRNMPITVDGLRFPGPAAMAFWHYSQPQRDQKLSLWASDNWGHLAGYEKQLMGINSPPEITEAWYFFNLIVAEAHHKGQSVSKSQRLWLAQQIANGGSGFKPHAGFAQDYAFSLKPKIVRYEATKPYRDMSAQARDEYNQLIAQPAKKLLASGAKSREIHVAWSDYIDKLLPYMQKNAPELWHVVHDVWPSHFVYDLTNN